VTLRVVAQALGLVGFVSLAVLSADQWRRRRSAGSAWLALTFGTIGVVVLAGRFLPEHPTGFWLALVLKLLIILIVLFPYCLYRFSSAFGTRRGVVDTIAAGFTVATILATLALPRFITQPAALPLWYVAYSALFFVFWTLLSVLTVRRLWSRRLAQPTVARRRMRTLGVAAALLNVSVAVSIGSGSRKDGPVATFGQLLGVACTLLFVVGFVPPPFLRSMWRRKEVAAFRRAEADLMSADTAQRVIEIVLPHAADLAGAEIAIITDEHGAVIATHGATQARAAVIAGRLPTPIDASAPVVRGDLVAVRLRGGWLAMSLPTSTPFLGTDELSLLGTLAHFAGLALDRADLYDSERRSVKILADSETQLAEAQQTAQLGSFSVDLSTREITWSDEMYRVLGYEPGAAIDRGAALNERVHPDDLARLETTQRAFFKGALDPATEWRILLPTGEIRWIQFRNRFIYEAGEAVAVCGTAQDVTERKQAEAAIIFQATHDALTRLPNRVLFLDRLQQAMDARGDGNVGIAVLFMDLDRFKWLNDSLGHSVGDEVLKAFTARVRSKLRDGDVVARFGGDEFVALCIDVTPDEAEEIARDLAAAVGRPLVIDGEDTRLTMSVGIAYSPCATSGDTPETLLRDADAAMYRAKERGRDRVEAFDVKTREAALARHETANALRRGIDADELEVHYQPEVDIASGAVLGFEALVRWNHPQRGLLFPDEFIGFAEETGLIVPMGEEVLRLACNQLAAWRTQDDMWRDISLSVNLAARQLLSANLGAVVEEALTTSGIDPGALVLEITESVLLEDSDASARALGRLKDLGVRIAVDDFGTGFSSLTYLKRFPVDVLKIDRSFVEGLGQDEQDRAIVASVIDLAHGFGLTTIAEGIETLQQLSELRSLGCELGQGYLWSRPMTAPVASAWMANRPAPSLSPPSTVLWPVRSGRPRTVLLVEDDRHLRGLLKLIFEGEEDFLVIGETDDGREAVALARHHRPDLVLLDLAMPGMGGLEALPLIRAVAPGTTVVVLSGLDAPDRIELTKRKGAAAYLVKGGDPMRLCEQLRPLFAIAS
jgi:diguanylate cyclase (GGDEF)-like protein/PAS domain S-box-containing protein